MTVWASSHSGESRSGKAGERAAWRTSLCREDLQRLLHETSGADSVLRWARPFMRRSGNLPLLSAADSSISDVLAQSGAADDAGSPPVRLTRIARHLGVRLYFPPPADSHVAREQSTPDPRGYFGTIVPDGDRGWVLHVRTRIERFARETVAHEMSHAILFRRAERNDLLAWRSADWSETEESLVNYMARSLLAPANLVDLTTGDSRSLSSFVVKRIAHRFRVPYRVAAARWLDIGDRFERPVRAFILWRQYHPFDERRVVACFSHYADATRQLRRVSRILNGALGHYSFVDALGLWRRILHPDWPHPAAWATTSPREEELVREMSPFCVQLVRDVDPTRVEAFVDSSSRFFFRPEWVLWRGRPLDSFVPERRGAARAGSLVEASAAAGESAHSSAVENVNIGDLRGEYFVDAFGHGSAEKGLRFVLCAYCDLPE